MLCVSDRTVQSSNQTSNMETVATTKCKCGQVLRFINNPQATMYKCKCPVCGRHYWGDDGKKATETEIAEAELMLQKEIEAKAWEEKKYKEWCDTNAKFLLRFLKEHDFQSGGRIETWNGL